MVTNKNKNELPRAFEVFILINLKEVAKGYDRFLLRYGSAVRQTGNVYLEEIKG